MNFSRRRDEAKSTVVAGSVWESRIRFDEVRGGVKVFNGEEGTGECRAPTVATSESGQINGGVVTARRKTWKSEGSYGFAFFEKNSILIAEENAESRSGGDEQNPKSPIHGRKSRFEGSAIEVRKPIHESGRGFTESDKAVRESGERTAVRKKSDQSRKSADGFSSRIGGDAKQTTATMKVKSDSKTARKEESVNEIKRNKEKVICRVKPSAEVFVDACDSCSGEEDEGDEELEIENKRFDIKEINLPERKKIINEVKKFHQINGRTKPSSFTIKSQTFRENNQKLNSLMDLIMWRDILRSAIVFGTGASIIILSFFTKNFHISFVTVMSYLGLLYLAAIFLHRSIICRIGRDDDDGDYMVGEEDAIWFAKLFLPYINELMLNVKALFNGDPATTMKLAVVLFVLAKCGSFITIWNVVRWGFVGVFTVPKFWSWYSTQLITHGEHLMKHFGNAWSSSSHKKAMAIAIFFAVWNFSSSVARIWAVFILFVTFRYYQQSSVRDGWVEDEDETENEKRKNSGRGEKLLNGHTFKVNSKQKRNSDQF